MIENVKTVEVDECGVTMRMDIVLSSGRRLEEIEVWCEFDGRDCEINNPPKPGIRLTDEEDEEMRDIVMDSEEWNEHYNRAYHKIHEVNQ